MIAREWTKLCEALARGGALCPREEGVRLRWHSHNARYGETGFEWDHYA